MTPRFFAAFLLKLLAMALAGLLLALWLPSVWGAGRPGWLLAGGVALGAALLAGAGVALHTRRRDQQPDLSAYELTTLTFPPQRRPERPHSR